MPTTPNESGVATRITTTGLTAIAITNCNLLGIWCAPVNTTAKSVNLYHSSTAGGVLIIGTSTLSLNTFSRIPAYCSGGLTFAASNDNVDLTIFWNPAA